MTHDGAMPLLGDLLSGDLAEPTRRGVLEHVTACPECREVAETYVALGAGLANDRATGSHPSSAEIVRLALDEVPRDSVKYRRWTEHVGSCPTCAMEFEATRGAEKQWHDRNLGSPEPNRRPQPRTWSRAVPAAAVVLLAALAYPAYRGLVLLPRATGALEATRHELDRATSWSGTGSLPFLEAPTRNVAPAVLVIPVSADQPTVSLAVDPGLTGSYGGHTAIRFSIRDSRDLLVWSDERTIEQVERLAGTTDVVVLHLPARSLRDGIYDLQVARVGASEIREVFTRSFALVQTPDRDPTAGHTPQSQAPTATNAPQ